MKSIYQSLAKAKAKFPSIKKESANPYYKSKYADLQTILEAVEKPLLDEGILIMSACRESSVITSLVHIETGEVIDSVYQLTPGLNAQGKGSEITYARRYQIQCLLNLVAEDDDGNQATNKPEPKKFDGQGKLDGLQAHLNNVNESAEIQKAYKIWLQYRDEFSNNGQMDLFKQGVKLIESKGGKNA